MSTITLETEGKPFSNEEIQKLVKKRQLEDRINYATVMINRGLKYIQGYLYDYSISIKRDFRKSPLKVVLEVNCSLEELEEDLSTEDRKSRVIDVPKEKEVSEKDLNQQ